MFSNIPGVYQWHILPRQIDSFGWYISPQLQTVDQEVKVDSQPLKESI